MAWDQFILFLSEYEWVIQLFVVLAVAGPTLGIVTIYVIRAYRKTASRSLRAVLVSALAVIVAGPVVVGFWQWRRSAPPVGPADQISLAQLEELKTAPLTAPDNSSALPDSWPQWRGPYRDGVAGASGLRYDWTNAAPPVLWKRSVGGGYASLAVAGGHVYAMDRQKETERILCLEAATGMDVWSYAYPASYANLQYATGPRATPAMADGRVYTVGATGILLCLEAKPAAGKAKVLWQHNLLAEFEAGLPTWGVACSPLVEGDFVCVQPGGKKGSVVAFDRKSGALAWKALEEPTGYSSPVAATAAGIRQVIAFTAKGVTGLCAESGRQLWSYAWSTANDANIATPIVAADYVFISSAYNAGCALLRLIAENEDAVRVEPVYVKANRLMRNHHSSCVFRDGFLYGFDCGPGVLKCVDLRTGEERWASRGLAKGCLVYADGHLIVLTESGDLALIEANPEVYHEKGRVKGVLKGSDCWALPAVAGGRLFLRDHTQIVCLDLKK
jgi:outer membrane protein assembly factor BamB